MGQCVESSYCVDFITVVIIVTMACVPHVTRYNQSSAVVKEPRFKCHVVVQKVQRSSVIRSAKNLTNVGFTGVEKNVAVKTKIMFVHLFVENI